MTHHATHDHMTGTDQLSLARMLEGSELQQVLRCILQFCYCYRSLIPLSTGMQHRQQRMDRH